MKLANNEQVINDWEYSSAKAKKSWFRKSKTSSSLILTNRRLIHQINSKHVHERTDINLGDIVSVDYRHSKLANFWAVLQLIIGIPLCLAIIGIFIVKDARRRLNRGEFILSITTAGNSSLSVGSRRTAKQEGLLISIIKLPFRLLGTILGIRSGVKNFEVQINHKAVDEIMDNLGAAMLNCRAYR